MTHPNIEFAHGWQTVEGVQSPEFAATACWLDIRVKGQSATAVDDERGGGVRRSLQTFAYPLAEWMALNWWTLGCHTRPSAVSADHWAWRNVDRHEWLRFHNLRGVGAGLAWPDMTIVPEGSVTRVRSNAGQGLLGQPLRFLTDISEWLPAAEVRSAMATFVSAVIARLTEAGVTNTPLTEEWHTLTQLDDEERDFARAAARLGLDPLDVSPEMAARIIAIAEQLPADLLTELLNAADPMRLTESAEWLDSAQRVIEGGAQVPVISADNSVPVRTPHETGYTAARHLRSQLELSSTDPADLAELVPVSEVGGNSGGLRGVALVDREAVGLGVPRDSWLNEASRRFAQGRALGFACMSSRRLGILEPSHSDLSKATRAFAAEFIAPAAGIQEYLTSFGEATEDALAEIAGRYGANPATVAYQYENQLASDRDE